MNCGPPPFAPDSYIFPYANTLEGTTVMYIYYRNQFLLQTTAICTEMGHWEPNINRICTVENSGILITFVQLHCVNYFVSE